MPIKQNNPFFPSSQDTNDWEIYGEYDEDEEIDESKEINVDNIIEEFDNDDSEDDEEDEIVIEKIDNEEDDNEEEDDEEDEVRKDDSLRNWKKGPINKPENRKILYAITRNFLNNTNIENIEKVYSSKIKNNSFFSIESNNKKISTSEILIITLSDQSQYFYLEKERVSFPLKTTIVNIIEYKNRGRFDFSKMKTKKDEEKIII